MKNLLLVIAILLVPSIVLAKKPAPSATVAVAKKAAKIDKAEIMEGRLINAYGAQAQAAIDQITKTQTARIVDYQARMRAQYGLDFTAGDSVDLDTGVIAWHVDKPKDPKPKISVDNATPTQGAK